LPGLGRFAGRAVPACASPTQRQRVGLAGQA
jgi:hypothetical protein